MKKVAAFLAGLTTTYVIAVVLVSQLNIARVTELGYAVGLSDRIAMVLHDWVGMLGAYLPLMAIALLIAWVITALVVSRFVPSSAALYALAGFTGMLALHLILHAVFQMTPVAPTRTLFGLISQGVAGALGGYLYFRFAYGESSQRSG